MKTVKFKIIKSVPINHMFTNILLCLFAGLFIQTVSAQTQPPQENFALKQSTPTSPEAAMLGRFGDIPIGYYTGTANVSVPIYTIKEGGVEIPITLSYHNSGIRVEDEASNVGLGWDEMLTVNGTIHSTEVKVTSTVPYPDYVFKPPYKLSKLSDVKNYIDKNHHLPDVPTEAEVGKNGLNVGQSETLLLKKVEELTLYLIEKDKQLSKLISAVKRQTS